MHGAWCYLYRAIDADGNLVDSMLSERRDMEARVPACGCRQLAKGGIAFEAPDNGIRSCADPARMQAIADELSAERIDALLRKWLVILPHPFTPDDRAAAYTYEVSVLQAEFALTQVLDRPLSGRLLFDTSP